jgi:hypothetical protein
MITVSDFIEILLHFHKIPSVNILDELEKHKIKTWRGKQQKKKKKQKKRKIGQSPTEHCSFPSFCGHTHFFQQKKDIFAKQGSQSTKLVHVFPETTIYEASETLLRYKFHRLPVIDRETNNILQIMTHYGVLSFAMKEVNSVCFFFFSF